MNTNEVKKLFQEINFECVEFGNDFLEFHGKMKNSEGVQFDIEGSFEIKEEEIAYSLNFYDEEKECEYDGMIGTIKEPTKENLLELLTPNFVSIS